MNTLFIGQRLALFLLLLGVASLSACKKETDVTPTGDLGTRAAGQYTFSSLTFNGKTLPASQADMKGTIKLTRTAPTTVTVEVDIRTKSSNGEIIVDSVAGVALSSTGADGISLSYEGTEIATIKGSTISINSEDSSGVPFTISATR